MTISTTAARRSAVALALALAALAGGCGPKVGKAADPGKARQGLEAGLEAWKRGDAPDSLAARNIYFNDREWRAGAKLSDYKVTGEPTPFGLAVQVNVTLTLTDGKAKAAPKPVTYLINTDAATTIARADADN